MSELLGIRWGWFFIIVYYWFFASIFGLFFWGFWLTQNALVELQEGGGGLPHVVELAVVQIVDSFEKIQETNFLSNFGQFLCFCPNDENLERVGTYRIVGSRLRRLRAPLCTRNRSGPRF